LHETHFEIYAASFFILRGRSGSLSKGLERDISSIFEPLITDSIVSRLLNPPTTMTGQLTASATSSAAETKYPSLTCALIPPTVEYSLAERSRTIIPALESVYKWAADQMKTE